MATKQFIVGRFRAWLEILDAPPTSPTANGPTGRTLPITQLVLNAVLTGESQAVFLLPSGYPLGVGNGIASLKSVLGSITSDKHFLRCWIRGYGNRWDGKRWPSNPLMVWQGYVTGVGRTWQGNSARYSISATSWTALLDEGVMASRDIIKGSATDITPTLYDETTGISTSLSIANIGEEGVSAPGSDFFNSILVPMLSASLLTSEEGASLEHPGLVFMQHNFAFVAPLSGTDQDQINALTQGNKTAFLKMLDFMTNNERRINTSPLSLSRFVGKNANETAGSSPTEAMRFAVSDMVCSGYQSAGLIDLIRMTVQQFGLSLVTSVDAGTLAPVSWIFPKTQVWRRLGINDYAGINASGFAPTAIKAVWLRGTRAPQSVNQNANVNSVDSGMVGLSTQVKMPGKIHIIGAPGWVTNMASNDAHGPDGLLNAPVGTNFSNYVYGLEAFGNRQLSLQTPFRLDIAPGSALQIDTFDTSNNQLSATTVPMFGRVGAVRITMDVESRQANTELQLLCVRTDAEETAATTTNPRHPIFDEAWVGTPWVVMEEADLTPLSTDGNSTLNTPQYEIPKFNLTTSV